MVKMLVLLGAAAATAASAATPELAVALTNGGVFKVLTDPQKAEAVFTDHIGASLERSLHELYQPVEKIENGKPNDNFKPMMAPLSRGKQSIFLVNRTTRAELWSTYAPPKDSQSDSLNRLAVRIAGQLQKDLKAK